MNLSHVFDFCSALLVIGGTLVATVLRSGWRDSRAAMQSVALLWARPFDASRVRAELAIQIREIAEYGLLRAEPHRFDDGEFDELSEALVRHRSVGALREEHARHRAHRSRLSGAAFRVLNEAAELAPVLGLVGTLLSLGGLAEGTDGGEYGRAIGMAVATTLYGLIAANFLFAPLAASVARRAKAEEQARQELLDWLSSSVEPATRAGHATHAATGRSAA